MKAIFKDLRVLDLSSVLAGPSVATFFAELGATVIKIENKKTGGDVTRTWRANGESKDTAVSAYWSSINYKKAVHLLDYSNPQERQYVYDLIPSQDVVIMNFKEGDDKKFGLDPASLFLMNSRLIIGEIYGFISNPGRVAYDVVLQAETGFMSINGEKNAAPLKMPVAMMDILAAHQLKEAILCALYEREKTGLGALVKCSLEKAGIASLANQASNYLMTGKVPVAQGSLHPNIAPYGEVMRCKDGGSIVLAIGSDRQFESLVKVMQLESLASDNRFQENTARVKNREELFILLSEAFSRCETSELMRIFESENIPAGKVKTLDEVLDSPLGKSMTLEEIVENTITKRLSSVAFEYFSQES
jgi:crotonobetainyl-CoA:carnitine CoA-transferase CaiB-like acyl-CoA transferase